MTELPTNADVYPVTALFENFWDRNVMPNFDEGGESHTDPINRAVCLTLFNVMRENLGEYEHGSADVDQVFEGIQVFDYDRTLAETDPDYDDRPLNRQMNEAYRAVCEDILMSLQAHLRD